MAMYIHFRKQTKYVVKLMNGNLRDIADKNAENQDIECSLSINN
ncbi:unnamed protein product [marine sediment metagenome]|uniref:Uncharacterized protein n=1 Tax=marine sediment metagenome TaxID=412755 RepID=X0VBB1_9ZZZZ